MRSIGSAITVFRIHDSEQTSAVKRFEETIEKAIGEIRRMPATEGGNVTVHVWISFHFIFVPGSDSVVLTENHLATRMSNALIKLDLAPTRPILVTLCPDSMHREIDSSISRTSTELAEILSQKGALTTSHDAIWRSMYVVFGAPRSVLRKYPKPGMSRSLIWYAIEKHLFHQRVFLMCAADS